MKNISLLLKKTILGFVALFIFTACSYTETAIDVGSLFDPTFDFSKASELTFDENNVEIKNGKVQLKPLDLKHEGDDFNNGSHVGSLLDQSVKLKLDLSVNSITNLKNILPARTSNLMGYWSFNDDFTDSSGNNNNGVVNGSPLIVSGRIGNAMFLDGSSYISVGSDASVRLVDSLGTYVAWIKTDTGVQQNVFDYTFFQPRLELQSNTMKGYWATNGDAFVPGGTSNLLASGEWVHIAWVFGQNSVKTFINGQAFGQASINTGTSASELRIGANSGSSSIFSGSLDEVAYWNTNLSQEEIDKIYQTQKVVYADHTELSQSWTPKWDNIVGYWKMDGNWQDSSGRGNIATPSGDVYFDFTDMQVGSSSSYFDGNGDNAEIVQDASLDMTSELTILAWVKSKAVQSDASFDFIYGGYGAGPAFDGYGFAIGDTTSSGNLSFFGGSWLYSNQRIDDETWHLVAATYNNGTTSLYIDGDLDNSGILPSPLDVNSANRRIGGLGTAGFPLLSFYGNIDELAIWDKALSYSDISVIYNRQKQKYAGHYDSEVIDLGHETSKWPDLSWSTNLPFGKELVGDFDSDGNPDSESSSDYPDIGSTLSNGIIGNWSMNEATLSLGALNDFFDSSVNSNHLEGNSPAMLKDNGKLNRSVHCGNSDKLNTAGITLGNSWSISSWFKTPFPDATNAYNVLARGTLDYHILVQESSGLLGTYELSGGASLFNSSSFDTRTLQDGWHHLVAVGENGMTVFYIDNNMVGTASFQATEPIDVIGNRQSLNQPWGWIDELTIWNRNLNTNEIQQLYRRGANRIKFQVKSCVDSSCECKSLSTSPVGSATDCDGDTIANALDFDDIYKAEFIGPGGDGTTYYSELFNRKGTDLTFNCGLNSSDSNSNVCVNDEITIEAGPRPTNPVIDYSDFPLEAKPEANPYIQYRVYMEADENTACDGSPCLPELTSVNLNPEGSDKFYGALQEVAANNPISYSSINSLTVTADDCATYQLSPNGSDFYYWSTSSWVLATVPSHRSSKEDLGTNIVSFSTQFGPGLLYIKSFLETNASQTQNCSVQSIDISYSSK